MQVVFNLVNGSQSGFLSGHEQISGIYLICIKAGDGNTAYRIDFFDAVYVISPENDTQQIIGIRQINVYRISFHTEVTTIQVNVIAYIKTVHQTT